MTLFIVLFAVNFGRTLLVIAVIYFGIRLFKRYVLPTLIDKGVKNMQQKMQNQQTQEQAKRPEGEVTVEKNQSNKHSSSKNNGDYVDFEEVD